MFAFSRYGRFAFALLAVSFTTVACSKVVDFDRDKIVAEDAGNGGDATAQTGGRDAATDARTDARVPTDAATDAVTDAVVAPDADADAEVAACDVDTHSGCAADELCCMTVDGPACQSTDPLDQCTGCAVACDMETSSTCTDRTCTCGDSPACEGQAPLCDAAAGACVQCVGDSDCMGDGAAGTYCVDSACSECDPGELADDISDDEGCSGATPVCGDGNVCVGCSVSPDNCPGPLYCVDGEGCFGCDPAADVGSNGCPAVTPVCEASGGDYACRPCNGNGDCPGAYCDNPANGGGSCQEACDPDNNAGCNDAAAPFCVVSQGVASCVPCTEPTAPSCPDGEVCKASGARAGECLECRNDGDCDAAGQGVCDTTSYTCRGCRAASQDDDCNGDVCDTGSGECVECVFDNDCGARQICRNNNTCQNVECTQNSDCGDQEVCDANNCEMVDCTRDSQCPPSAPHCRVSNNTCEPCNAQGAGGDSFCQGLDGASGPVCTAAGSCEQCDPVDHTGCARGSATPFCDPTVLSCRGCNAANAGADAFCTLFTDGDYCATSGANTGRCGRCDPADDDGCSGNTPICNGSQSCVACTTDNSCGGGRYCSAAGACFATCDPDDDRGCNNANAAYCVVSGGSASCVGCGNAAVDCPNGEVCAGSGRCVECTGSGSGAGLCDPAGNQPYCDSGTGTCEGCDTASNPDTACESAISSANAVCDTNSGSCDCDTGFYGASCTACACNANETCDEGIDGSGECTCISGSCPGDSCEADGDCASDSCDLSGGTPGVCE